MRYEAKLKEDNKQDIDVHRNLLNEKVWFRVKVFNNKVTINWHLTESQLKVKIRMCMTPHSVLANTPTSPSSS